MRFVVNKFLGTFSLRQSHAIFGTLSESVKKKGSPTLSFNRRQQFKQFLTVLTGAAAAENETATAAGGSFA